MKIEFKIVNLKQKYIPVDRFYDAIVELYYKKFVCLRIEKKTQIRMNY